MNMISISFCHKIQFYGPLKLLVENFVVTTAFFKIPIVNVCSKHFCGHLAQYKREEALHWRSSGRVEQR